MKKSNLVFIGLFLYIFISLFTAKKMVVRAEEMKEKVEDIIENEMDQYNDIEELEEESNDDGLHDVIQHIKKNYLELEENQKDSEERDNGSENKPENEETMTNNNDQYFLMIIFSIGVLSGIIAGHFLTGFIK